LYTRLRKQFSEEQLLQLAGQIAFENYRAPFQSSLRRRERQPYQGITAR
jgi:alkylhydroperoxidase family enzyme